MVGSGACKAHGPPAEFISAVDEVEVSHRKVGANRRFGKIERSADASQGGHALIHSPFEKQYVKPTQVTARQNVLHVAIQYRLCAMIKGAPKEPFYQEGAFPIKLSNLSIGRAQNGIDAG
jgi:hypothetical protein